VPPPEPWPWRHSCFFTGNCWIAILDAGGGGAAPQAPQATRGADAEEVRSGCIRLLGVEALVAACCMAVGCG